MDTTNNRRMKWLFWMTVVILLLTSVVWICKTRFECAFWCLFSCYMYIKWWIQLRENEDLLLSLKEAMNLIRYYKEKANGKSGENGQ